MQAVQEGEEMEMSIQRKASQEAAAAIYGNDSSVATTSNRYVTFEQEAAMKKGKSAGGGSPSNDANRRATRISLDSLLSQVKGDHDKLSEKEKRLVKVLKDLDADHDGTVSLMEIAQLGSKLEQAEEEERKLKTVVAILSLLLVGSLLAIFLMSYAAAEASKEVRVSPSGNSVAKGAATIYVPPSESDGKRRRLGNTRRKLYDLWGNTQGKEEESWSKTPNRHVSQDAGYLSATLSKLASFTPAPMPITTSVNVGGAPYQFRTPSASLISPEAKAKINKNFDGTPAPSIESEAYSYIATKSSCRDMVLSSEPELNCGWCVDKFRASGCARTYHGGALDLDYEVELSKCAECSLCVEEEIHDAAAGTLAGACLDFQNQLREPVMQKSESEGAYIDSPASEKAKQEAAEKDEFNACVVATQNKAEDAPFVNPPECHTAGMCLSDNGYEMPMTTAAGCHTGATEGTNAVNTKAVTENIGMSIDTPIDISREKLKQLASRLAEANSYKQWEAENIVCTDVAEQGIPIIQAGETRYVVANPCLPPGAFADCPRATIVEHEARTQQRMELAKTMGTEFQPFPKLEFEVNVATPVTITPSECNRMELSVSGDILSQLPSSLGHKTATSETTDIQKMRDGKITMIAGGKIIIGENIKALLEANGLNMPGSDSLMQQNGPTTLDRGMLRAIMHCNSFTVSASDLCGAKQTVDKVEAANSYAQANLQGENGESEDEATVNVLPTVTPSPTSINPEATYMYTVRDHEECSHLPAGFGCVEQDLDEDTHVERDESGDLYRVTDTRVYHHGAANVEVRVTVPPPEVDQNNKGGQTPTCEPLMFSRIRVKIQKRAPDGEKDEVVTYTMKHYTAKSVRQYYKVMGGGPDNDWIPGKGGTYDTSADQMNKYGADQTKELDQNFEQRQNTIVSTLSQDTASDEQMYNVIKGFNENSRGASGNDIERRYGNNAGMIENGAVTMYKDQVPECSYTPMTFDENDVETCGQGPCVFSCEEKRDDNIPLDPDVHVPEDAEHVSDATMISEAKKRRALRKSHARRELSGIHYNRKLHERLTPLERALRTKLSGHNSLTYKDKKGGRRLVGEGTADCFLDQGASGDTYCEICSRDDHEYHLELYRGNRRLNKLVPNRRHLGDQSEAIKRQNEKITDAKAAAELAGEDCAGKIRNRNEAVANYHTQAGSKDLNDPAVMDAANLVDWARTEMDSSCGVMEDKNSQLRAAEHDLNVIEEAHDYFLQNQIRLQRIDDELEEMYSEAERLEMAYSQAEQKAADALVAQDDAKARLAEQQKSFIGAQFDNVKLNMTHTLHARDAIAVMTLLDTGKADTINDRKKEMCSLQVYHKKEGTHGAMRKTTKEDVQMMDEAEMKAMVFRYIPVSKSGDFFSFKCAQPEPFEQNIFNEEQTDQNPTSGLHQGPPSSAAFLQFDHGKELPPLQPLPDERNDEIMFNDAQAAAIKEFKEASEAFSNHQQDLARVEEHTEKLLQDFEALTAAEKTVQESAQTEKKNADAALKEWVDSKIREDQIHLEKAERLVNETAMCPPVPPECSIGYVLKMENSARGMTIIWEDIAHIRNLTQHSKEVFNFMSINLLPGRGELEMLARHQMCFFDCAWTQINFRMEIQQGGTTTLVTMMMVDPNFMGA
eukprot:g2557.t1